MINQLDAMDATIELMERRLSKGYSLAPEDVEHLRGMYPKMTEMDDEAKIGRWLGWAQGFLCSYNIVTLEECKDINRGCKV